MDQTENEHGYAALEWIRGRLTMSTLYEADSQMEYTGREFV